MAVAINGDKGYSLASQIYRDTFYLPWAAEDTWIYPVVYLYLTDREVEVDL